MIRSMSLCLTCSSSIPPKHSAEIFFTPCCSRPICPSCIAANPRLARYNPCLSCLGGVGVVGAAKAHPSALRNLDGAVRDQDVFSLGEDDSDDDAETVEDTIPPQQPAPDETVAPSKYYLKRTDTLKGIVLRSGIDGHELCRLNNLPPSTLSTTPHLLHTRGFLILPPSAHSQLRESDTRPTSVEERAREVRRVRERAAKRLQTLTKETDWRVAKAYLALADDPFALDSFAIKQKELGGLAAPGLEAVAVDHYLDDSQWEAAQLKAGRVPRILPLPVSKAAVQSSSKW